MRVSVTALPSHVHGDVCAYVATQDCAFIPDRNNVCGTDGVTYRNKYVA